MVEKDIIAVAMKVLEEFVDIINITDMIANSKQSRLFIISFNVIVELLLINARSTIISPSSMSKYDEKVLFD